MQRLVACPSVFLYEQNKNFMILSIVFAVGNLRFFVFFQVFFMISCREGSFSFEGNEQNVFQEIMVPGVT